MGQSIIRVLLTLLLHLIWQACTAQLEPRYKLWDDNDYVVTASVLNVRESQDLASEVIDKIVAGTKVVSLESKVPPNEEQPVRSFNRIRYAKNGIVKEGYVANRYLSQFYMYDRSELIYLKIEEMGRLGNKFSLNSLQDGLCSQIGLIETEGYRNFNLKLSYPTYLNSVDRIIEVEFEDDDSCSSGYFTYTFIKMKSGEITTVPAYGHQITEPGDQIQDLRYPSDPYGEQNKLVLVEINFELRGSETKITEVKKLSTYYWNGDQWEVE